MKHCDCMPPAPIPQKGPSEYIPSMTYPDPFVNMVPGYVPMHRAGCCGPFVPACPPPPPPQPEPQPEWGCPPKIYRNPPEVEVKAGEHITVDKEILPDNSVASYTVNSVQWPVKIDEASEDVLYGDGTPENPLGVYDFIGATASEDGKPGTVPAPAKQEREYFLKGDGTWEPIVIPEQAQSDWTETDDSSPAYIRNTPKLARVATTGDYNDLKNIPPEIPVFSGATETADGTKGQVPAPSKSQRNYYLKGDGTWAEIVIPDQVQSDWNSVDEAAPEFIRNKPGVFAGATQAAAGSTGFVPAPQISEREMFLRGDGTWSVVDNTRECTAAEMNSWLDEVDNG